MPIVMQSWIHLIGLLSWVHYFYKISARLVLFVFLSFRVCCFIIPEKRWEIFFWRKSKTSLEINDGNVGPNLIFLTLHFNNANNTETAFCSYHERIIETGNSLISQLNTFVNALTNDIILKASLHCPQSIYLGIPSISPNSFVKNLNLPHAHVKIKQSFGIISTNCSK